MSSILRIINGLRELHVGDYVEFHGGRLGYVDKIVPNNCVRIIEDDGTNKSTRVRIFTVRKNMVASVAQVGNSQTNNRTLIQPPEPYETDKRINSEDFSYETNELISVLKDTKKWTSNSKNLKHPFLNYLEHNNHREEGWIRKLLPNTDKQNVSHKDLNNREKMIFVTTYNLFAGFPKTHGPLKGWQQLFFDAWGVSKWTANRIVDSYYDNGFNVNRKTRNDKGMTLLRMHELTKIDRHLVLVCHTKFYFSSSTLPFLSLSFLESVDR